MSIRQAGSWMGLVATISPSSLTCAVLDQKGKEEKQSRADGRKHRGKQKDIPSRASSKQCLGSQWLVKMTTLFPRFWRPTAASTTSLSAPPMPRSGCRKTIVFLFLPPTPLLSPRSAGSFSAIFLLTTSSYGDVEGRNLPCLLSFSLSLLFCHSFSLFLSLSVSFSVSFSACLSLSPSVSQGRDCVGGLRKRVWWWVFAWVVR